MNTRIRIKFGRLLLKEFQVHQLSQSYCLEMRSTHETYCSITRNVWKQCEVHAFRPDLCDAEDKDVHAHSAVHCIDLERHFSQNELWLLTRVIAFTLKR